MPTLSLPSFVQEAMQKLPGCFIKPGKQNRDLSIKNKKHEGLKNIFHGYAIPLHIYELHVIENQPLTI
jgi:hypothetical protein